MGKEFERREAGHGGHFHVLQVVSEFNEKLPGNTYGSMNNPFVSATSVYTCNWYSCILHVDSVIFFTNLKSELFQKPIITLGLLQGGAALGFHFYWFLFIDQGEHSEVSPIK